MRKAPKTKIYSFKISHISTSNYCKTFIYDTLFKNFIPKDSPDFPLHNNILKPPYTITLAQNNHFSEKNFEKMTQLQMIPLPI